MAVEAGKYADVYRSWQQRLLNFNLAVRETQTPVLRKPQLAALYAALGHLVMAPAPKSIPCRASLMKTFFDEAALSSGNLLRQFPAVFADHRAFDAFLDSCEW
jgi:hypothetical protein